MNRYYFESVDATGRRAPGILECETEERLSAILEEKGQTLVRVSTRPLTTAAAAGRNLKAGGATAAERGAFADQMARLTESACPMDRALELAEGIAQTRTFSAAVLTMRDDVQQGTSLHEAIGKHPAIFSKLFVATIEAGETGGFIPKAFANLSVFEKNQDRLRRKVVGSLMYPAFMILTLIVCLAVIFTFVIPSLVGFFKSSGMTLPLPTVVLITLSDNAVGIFGSLFTVIAVVVGAQMLWGQQPAVKTREDALMLKVPVLGDLVQRLMLGRFCRTMTLLLSGGVVLTRALEITRSALDNATFQSELARVVDQVTAGESLSRCLEVCPLFPAMLTGQVRFGEETGSLARALESLAGEYETQSESALDTLVGLVEPMIILFMGLVIGSVVLAIFMPMVTMVNVQ
jgi:type IV pilus assembly protein PilC